MTPFLVLIINYWFRQDFPKFKISCVRNYEPTYFALKKVAFCPSFEVPGTVVDGEAHWLMPVRFFWSWKSSLKRRIATAQILIFVKNYATDQISIFFNTVRFVQQYLVKVTFLSNKTFMAWYLRTSMSWPRASIFPRGSTHPVLGILRSTEEVRTVRYTVPPVSNAL